MPDDDRGGHGPTAGLSEQLRSVRAEQAVELGKEVAFLTADLGDPSQQRASDPQLRARGQPGELT
jgi:hypothetical protein